MRRKLVLAVKNQLYKNFTIGNLIYGVASKLTNSSEDNREKIVKYILDNKINSSYQLDRAIKFLKENAHVFNNLEKIQEFERYCGVILSHSMIFNSFW